MSTLDEINNEKHLVGQALARIDAQREQLSNQLSEFSEPDRIHTREDYYSVLPCYKGAWLIHSSRHTSVNSPVWAGAKSSIYRGRPEYRRDCPPATRDVRFAGNARSSGRSCATRPIRERPARRRPTGNKLVPLASHPLVLVQERGELFPTALIARDRMATFRARPAASRRLRSTARSAGRSHQDARASDRPTRWPHRAPWSAP